MIERRRFASNSLSHCQTPAAVLLSHKALTLNIVKFRSDLEFLAAILGLSEDDIIRAVIANYCLGQLGPRVASIRQRKNYGTPVSAAVLRKMFQLADYKCTKCGGSYRLSIDHVDNDAFNNDPTNLQVLCSKCNRAKRKCGVAFSDPAIALVKSLRQRVESGVAVGTPSQELKAVGAGVGGSAYEKAIHLIHRINTIKT